MTLAFDGGQALELATAAIFGAKEGLRYDASITDLNMPHLSGEELIRALRVRHPELPVVVAGSPPFGGAEELRRHGGGHGPLALLRKPVGDTELLEALQRVVAPRDAPSWADVAI